MTDYKTPDPFASNAEKTSEQYGLQYARFIESEWISSGKINKRNQKFRELEAFKNNDVDTEQYKHMLGMCEKRIWTGMNWKFTPIAPKFVNVIKDGFATDLFKIQTKAVDAISAKERDTYKKRLESDMLTAEFTKQISMITGTNYAPEYTPESEEELDMHMQLKYKQPREIASELIINRILDYNDWNETKNKIAEDLIVKGMAAVRITPDKDYGVDINRSIPENIVYSYDTRSSRNKKGCFYFGEVKKYTPGEILRMSGGTITKQQIAANSGQATSATGEDDHLVDVLWFCFKTTLSKKEKTKNTEPAGTYDIWFEGYHITGSQLTWGYRIMQDMIRPSNDMTKTLPPFVVYQLSVPSVVENIMPFCEDAHIAVLKLRHLVLRARPKGYIIDIDVINNIDIGAGGVMKPIEVINIFNQTGDLLMSSRGFDENEKDFRTPIREINSSLGVDLGQLISVYNNAINMCYEVSGLNRVRDGSAPLVGASVGGQQIALSMSNTATKHILNALLTIEKDVAEISLNRSQQLAIYGDTFADEIMESFIDKQDKVRDELFSSHKYRFDVVVEIAPDQNERQDMDANINNALQSGQIQLTDAIDIKNIHNIKLANEYLKILMRKRSAEKQRNDKTLVRERENARAQAEIAIQQVKIQAAQQEINVIQTKAQAEIAVNNANIEKTTEANLIIMRQKHIYEMGIEQTKVKAGTELNKFKEESKDNRSRQQANQQSELIFQRQNATSPTKFDNPPAYPDSDTQTIYPNETNQQYGPQETTIQPTF